MGCCGVGWGGMGWDEMRRHRVGDGMGGGETGWDRVLDGTRKLFLCFGGGGGDGGEGFLSELGKGGKGPTALVLGPRDGDPDEMGSLAPPII